MFERVPAASSGMGTGAGQDSPLGPYSRDARWPIIAGGHREALLTDEIANLCDEIRALLDQPVAEEDGPSLEHLERTLTEGYARALGLEAERWRLERRINEVAHELRRGGDDGRTEELAILAAGLSHASGSLERLRGALVALRARADHVRELNPR